MGVAQEQAWPLSRKQHKTAAAAAAEVIGKGTSGSKGKSKGNNKGKGGATSKSKDGSI